VAEGVEWFIYNRTPAYDDILRHMQPDLPEARSPHPETSESAPFSNEADTSARPDDYMGSACFARLRQVNNNNSLPVVLIILNQMQKCGRQRDIYSYPSRF
jgi:hypothetical protein